MYREHAEEQCNLITLPHLLQCNLTLLSDKLDNTTGSLDLLLSRARDEAGLDDEGLGNAALAELRAGLVGGRQAAENVQACGDRVGRGRSLARYRREPQPWRGRAR